MILIKSLTIMTELATLKIVSLLPSATEIIDCLGLISALVGRSHECDYPPSVKDLPVCTEARLNSDLAPRGTA